MPFQWEAGGLTFSFELPDNRLRFRHVLPLGIAAPQGLPELGEMSGIETSIHCTGEDIPDHHGAKFSGAYPGIRLRFAGNQEKTTPTGRQLVITQVDEATGLRVESIYASFGANFGNIAIVRRSRRLSNAGTRPLGIEYVSSAMLTNFAGPETFGDDLKLHFAHNSWRAEGQWRTMRLADAGLVRNGNFSVSGVSFSSIGSWPSQSYLPMAMLENTKLGVTWFWQIEHNGSWQWEIAQTAAKALYRPRSGKLQHGERDAGRIHQSGRITRLRPESMAQVKNGIAVYKEQIRRHIPESVPFYPLGMPDLTIPS